MLHILPENSQNIHTQVKMQAEEPTVRGSGTACTQSVFQMGCGLAVLQADGHKRPLKKGQTWNSLHAQPVLMYHYASVEALARLLSPLSYADDVDE